MRQPFHVERLEPFAATRIVVENGEVVPFRRSVPSLTTITVSARVETESLSATSTGSLRCDLSESKIHWPEKSGRRVGVCARLAGPAINRPRAVMKS